MFINKMIILIIFKISVLGHCLYMGNDLWYTKVNTVSSYFTQMTLEIWQVKVNFYECFFQILFCDVSASYKNRLSSDATHNNFFNTY